MKKLLVLLMLAGLMFAFTPAHAARTVSGTILVPTINVPPNPGVSGVFSRQERCAYTIGGDATNGVLGWGVPLTAAEGDGTHTFSIATTTAGSTAYVVWYEDLATCDANAVGATRPMTGSGTIPEFKTIGLVVIDGSPNSDFSLAIS